MEVSKDTKISELVQYPKAIEILQGKGFHCIGCFFASQESIEQGAKAHGMAEEEIEEIVKEINEAIKSGKEKE